MSNKTYEGDEDRSIEDTYEYKRGYHQAIRDVFILFMGVEGNLDKTISNMKIVKDSVRKMK